MKPTDFQDKVLEHLGEQTIAHAEIQRRLSEIEIQTKKTNGRVSALENWQSNLNGKIALVTAFVATGISWLWQIIKDKFIN